MKKLGVLIYTHDRVDDARINIEIIRNVWQKNKFFKNVEIVHSYNGKSEWYPKKYSEDLLVRTKNTWHFQGASDLIDTGVKKFSSSVEYVIVLAADTWLVKPEFLEKVISTMFKNNLLLATCAWGVPGKMELKNVGMATDFFVIDLKWARKNNLFPIRYGEFHKKYKDLFLYQSCGNVMLEKLMLARFVDAVGREQGFNGSAKKSAFEKILIMSERVPVHRVIRKDGTWERKMHWPKIGLLTHHDPLPKKKILKTVKITEGEHIKKLLDSSDLNYYNSGLTKPRLSSN